MSGRRFGDPRCFVRTPARLAFGLLLASVILGVASAAAQSPSTASVEVGYGESRLSANFPAWTNVYARATVSTGADRAYQVEAVGRRAFDDAGVYLGAAVTHPLARNWYGFATAGTSVGGFFFPRANVGAMVAKKWLGRQQLVTTSALNFYAQKDVHRDAILTGSVVYYFSRPAALEVGVNVGRSAPGAVMSHNAFVVGTVGDPLRYTLTARVAAGREAYTRVAIDTALVAFASHVFSFRWRQVVGRESGYVAELEHYSNVLYHRTGLSVGAFVGTALLSRVRRTDP
jgi:YaiO family outer membrane protein